MNNERAWEVQHARPELKGKTIQDFLYFEGMFNPTLRFAFTNILSEDFISYWDGIRRIIHPGETKKLTHYLAVKFTKEIVDKIMQDEGKAASMGVPAMRKPYEDKVLSLLPMENSEELETITQEFVNQVKMDLSRQVGVQEEPLEAPKMDFDDLRNKNFVEEHKTEVPIEIPKRGRPRKVLGK